MIQWMHKKEKSKNLKFKSEAGSRWFFLRATPTFNMSRRDILWVAKRIKEIKKTKCPVGKACEEIFKIFNLA